MQYKLRQPNDRDIATRHILIPDKRKKKKYKWELSDHMNPYSHTSIPQTRRAHHGNNSRSKQGCIDLYLSLASKRIPKI